MNQQWLIDHVLSTQSDLPESPGDERAYLSRDEAVEIVDETLDYLGAHGEETEYTYMRGHRSRLIHSLTMIPKAESEDARLLDVGCYGYMSYWAQRHLGYRHVIGIEWHPDSEEQIIRRTLRINDDTFELESHNFDISASDWPLEDRFDTVLFFEVLEHINTDPMGVMERINASMRDGGTLVMSVPNAVSYKTLREFLVGMPPWTYWFYEPDLSHEPRHCFEYTPIVFRSLLTAAGMKTHALKTIYSYSKPENEQEILEIARILGFEECEFGETMIAVTTKSHEGAALRYPDVLYSPNGYYANVYPRLRELLADRLSSIREVMHQHAPLPEPDDSDAPEVSQGIEIKPEQQSPDELLSDRVSELERQLSDVSRDRDEHRDWASELQQQRHELESQVAQLLFQSDCWMQREQEIQQEALATKEQAQQDVLAAQASNQHEAQLARARAEEAEKELSETKVWATTVSQENAELRAQVNELLFACDCYLQQINDPARCVQVIRQRRFRRALDRSKAAARKTPIARTVLRPVYRSAKKAIKRRT